MTTFAERLADAVARKRSQLCVGIDPVPASLPDGVGLAEFCRGIVDAVADVAVAVKPQAAFFEARGADGWRTFLDTCAYAREAGLVVIADAKRGDIGSTATAYAQAFLPLADAVTVNPYLGGDSVAPFLERAREHDAGVFCLVKTSNPGSGDVQDVELARGGTVWRHVARLVDSWDAHAVVGATYPREVAEARELMPRAVLLLPGVGAQGGEPADLAPAFAPGPASALPSASRSVIYASSGADWQEAARAEAERLRAEILAVAGG
ncbi:MAG TPA: orotidine-5'-phosphate decarboxylase [Gaiellaceae bacterium]|nr:orotidine-5'-phosphate decarboxylase [Gaiellaceae bacterium]